jgi:hypothetical protein
MDCAGSKPWLAGTFTLTFCRMVGRTWRGLDRFYGDGAYANRSRYREVSKHCQTRAPSPCSADIGVTRLRHRRLPQMAPLARLALWHPPSTAAGQLIEGGGGVADNRLSLLQGCLDVAVVKGHPARPAPGVRPAAAAAGRSRGGQARPSPAFATRACKNTGVHLGRSQSASARRAAVLVSGSGARSRPVPTQWRGRPARSKARARPPG